MIPKIATGFCGGISRTCGICGAVSGAIMALDIFTGRVAPNDPVIESYAAARRMIEIFTASFGSTNCRELTGVDLGTEEGQKRFKEENIRERCKGYTREAAGMAAALLEDKLKTGGS